MIDLLNSTKKPGWTDIESKLNSINTFLNVKPESSFIDHHGLLKIVYPSADNTDLQELLNIITWYFERQAAKICQQCGALGFRRRVFSENPTLCQQCYVFEYNNRFESGVL